MTEGYMKCDKCGVFFNKDSPHLKVETRYTELGKPNPRHYCSACEDKVFRP